MDRFNPKCCLITLTFITCLCLIESGQLTDIKVLQRTTCEAVYKKAQGNRKDINFTNPIENLSCKPGPNGFIRYHCMENEDGHFLQFCAEWIWIVPRLCPKLYSLQGIINPVECDKTKGCPTERYQSHEYYKYHACFNITKKNEGITEKQGKLENPKSEGQLGGGLIALIVIGVTVSVITAITVTVLLNFILWRRGIIGNHMTGHGYELPENMKLLVDDSIKQERPLDAAKAKLNAGVNLMVTGLPGSGTETFIKHVKERCQDRKWQTVKYKSLSFDEKKGGIVLIEHNVLKVLFKASELSDLKQRMDGPSVKCVFIMNVKRKWYNKNYEKFKRDLDVHFGVIDLSSEEYRLNEEEKLNLIDKACENRNISEMQLSSDVRNQMSAFNGENCGFLQLFMEFLEENDFSNPVQKLREIDERHIVK